MRIKASRIRVGDKVRRPGAGADGSTVYTPVQRVYPPTTLRSGESVVRVSFGLGTGAQWPETAIVSVIRPGASPHQRLRSVRFVPVANRTSQRRDSDAIVSEFITGLAYDSSTQELRVYIHGKPYPYTGVSRHVFYRLRKARSVGRFYTKNVRGKYDRAEQVAS